MSFPTAQEPVDATPNVGDPTREDYDEQARRDRERKQREADLGLSDQRAGYIAQQARQQLANRNLQPDETTTPQHTAAEEEYLTALYAELKPLAVQEYINYFLARTPAHLQADMKAMLEADLAEPPVGGAPEPDPTVATIANGASVVVLDAAGTAVAGSPAAATVADSVLSDVKLTV